MGNGRLDMEGENLSTDGDDLASNPTRRRVLKASAALSATGVVTGAGFVGTAAGTHSTCPIDVQCGATEPLVFNKGTVSDGCAWFDGTVNDCVTVSQVAVTCEFGGWVDVHDAEVRTGPSGTFKAGYPVGVSTFLQQGTHTDVCIPLFESVPCIDWNRSQWPNNENPKGTRGMKAMPHVDSPSDQEFRHYCGTHENPKSAPDHAYLCDQDDDGTLEPIFETAQIVGDGTV